MFNVGPAELLVIFLIALLVFGPNKLPEVGRQVGRAVREFRRFQESMRDEVRDVFEPVYGGEPPRLPPRDALGAPRAPDEASGGADGGDEPPQGYDPAPEAEDHPAPEADGHPAPEADGHPAPEAGDHPAH